MSSQSVCVVTHPLSAAGENAARTLLDILAEIGPVSLVTADLPADSAIRDDREIVELTHKGSGENAVIAAVRFVVNQVRMCAVIRQRPENFVLFFGATAYLLPIVFARIIGKTVFVEPRGDVPLTLRLNWEQQMPAVFARILAGSVRLLERIGFTIAHKIVTYTPNMARELNLNPDSQRVYPQGARYVDKELFRPMVPFEERGAVIGFVGRLDEEKGIRILATVAQQLPDEVTFRFVGDGPLFEWLESHLASEIEEGSVELAGWVDHDNVPAELNQMKLLVMPSHPTEGLPTTILESLACGTPVFATPVSGVTDVVVKNETGLSMNGDSTQQLAHRIDSALNGEKLNSMSPQCRGLIEKEYSFKPAVERYRSLFEGFK